MVIVNGVIPHVRNVGDQLDINAYLVFPITIFTIMLALQMNALELLICRFLLRDCVSLVNLDVNTVILLSSVTSVLQVITSMRDGVT